jgi:uncharacterized protein YdeI (YjbR/CyaY-like superfamily)
MGEVQVELPDDLVAALKAHPDAQAIWDGLSDAHRRGHVIAIERVADPDKRAEKVHHLIEHLVDDHGH